MEIVWLGADWDKDKCVVAYGPVRRPRKKHVARTPEDVAAFVDSFGGKQVYVGIEAGDQLWPKLWRKAGAFVSVFDGKKAKRYAESLKSSYARDDLRSAVALRSMVESEHHRAEVVHELEPEQEGWSMLLSAHDDASNEVVRYTNRLRSILQTAHPAFAMTLKGVDARWVLRVLMAAPTTQAWAELPKKKRDELLKGTAHERRSRYLDALGTDYGLVPHEVEQALRLRVRGIVTMLETALVLRKQAQIALDREAKHSNEVAAIRNVAGVGPVLSVGLAFALAHGSAARPGERDAPAILTGAAPVTIRSGTLGDQSPIVSMRRSASAQVRRIPHLLGPQLVLHHRWAKHQHAYNKSRGKTTYASYRAITRSFLRVLSALLRDGTTFDEDLYIQRARSKGAAWAQETTKAA